MTTSTDSRRNRAWLWVKHGKHLQRLGEVTPAGPNGWPPEMTCVFPAYRQSFWWARWLLCHSYRQAWRRFVVCRRQGHEDVLYDGHICMRCGKDVYS